MDTSDMGTSNLDTGDNEPSMEDILASIRQIIADDEVEDTGGELDMTSEEDFAEPEETVESEAVQDAPVQISEAIDTEAQAAQGDNSDILDLMNFMDESTDEVDAVAETVAVENKIQEDVAPEVAIDEVLDLAAPTVGFDESLDLVMDADASDYVTTKLGTDTAQVEDTEFSLENALFADIEEQNGSAEENLVIPDIPKDAKAAVEPESVSAAVTTGASAIAAGQVQVSHDEDMDLVKSLLADLMEEPVEEEVVSSEDDGIDLHSDFEDALSDTGEAEEVSVASTDVDFITGEAIDADALDAIFDDDQPVVVAEVALEPEVPEEVAETVIESREDAVQERDFVTGEMIDSIDEAAIFGDDTPSALDEVLQQSVEDEVALHEELTVEPQNVAPEPIPEPEVVEAEVSDNNEVIEKLEVQADIEPVVEAPSVAEAPKADAPVEDVTNAEVITYEDDVVVLPEIAADSKFSLLTKASVGASALGLGAAAALMKNGDAEEAQAVEVPSVEPEIPVQEQAELPPQKNVNEKDDTMAQAAKTETLLDMDTATGSASAFASLNTAVQEKTKMEESGPAIGDLVQEALKPMLKEWLDKNLKGIVERAVTKEVKRISSGK